MDFDFGTVCSGYSGCWWGNYDIGKGMADQVVDALVNDGNFRVIERKKLDTVLAEQDFAQSERADPSAAKMAKVGKVLGVRYIIAGSITKFGGEDKSYGAGGIVKGPVGGARVQEVQELRHPHRAHDRRHHRRDPRLHQGRGHLQEGRRHHRGRRAAAASSGRVGMSSSNYRESALGEAQEMACNLLVAAIVAKKDRLE